MRPTLAACAALIATAPAILADSEQEDLRWWQPHGPSFDCREAQTAVDRTVCDDPLLARLDLEMSDAYDAAMEEATGVMTFNVDGSVPEADVIEAKQQQWLNARDSECSLDFDFDTQLEARFEATSCLIASYAKRLVEMGEERRALDALVDTRLVDLRPMEFAFGSVRIELPRVLPATRHEPPSVATPHPACIYKLLGSGSTELRRDACHVGTAHLPAEAGIYFYDDENGVSYGKWGPHRFDQRGDLFGYRHVGALSDGRTVIHAIDQSTGAGRTTTWSTVAVMRGFTEGDTIAVEQVIKDEGVSGFCSGGIGEVTVVDSRILRFTSWVSVETMLTLFEWFPEDLHRVSPSNRGLLLAMRDDGDFFVPMSIIGSSCIGRAHYHHDLETGSRTLTEVSIEVTQLDRESLASFPTITCLFKMMDGRLPDITMTLRPSDLENMIVQFVESCSARAH